MAKKTTSIIDISPQSFKDMIYIFRGQQVMLDSDLAAIYGYETKTFNQQIKNNIERFDEEEFMFQLTEEEFSNLKSKNLTSSWGGVRKRPFVFTEQGVYMLMAVLKGPLAVQQSKQLMRLFKQMKDYIIQNQPLLGQREYLQLSLQTTQNVHEIMEVRSSLSKVEDKVAKIVDTLGEVVTKSELSHIMLDFGEPAVRRGWLILNGQPVESDLAYKQIYSLASSKDGGNKVMTLNLITDTAIYHPLIDNTLQNPPLQLT